MLEKDIRISRAPGADTKMDTPAFKIQGQWLKELGFEVGSSVHVKASKNRIVITKNVE